MEWNSKIQLSDKKALNELEGYGCKKLPCNVTKWITRAITESTESIAESMTIPTFSQNWTVVSFVTVDHKVIKQ